MTRWAEFICGLQGPPRAGHMLWQQVLEVPDPPGYKKQPLNQWPEWGRSPCTTCWERVWGPGALGCLGHTAAHGDQGPLLPPAVPVLRASDGTCRDLSASTVMWASSTHACAPAHAQLHTCVSYWLCSSGGPGKHCHSYSFTLVCHTLMCTAKAVMLRLS